MTTRNITLYLIALAFAILAGHLAGKALLRQCQLDQESTSCLYSR